MPDQPNLDSLNFDKNPFMEMLGGGLQAAQQMPQEGGDEQAMAMTQQGGGGQGAPQVGAVGGAGKSNQLEYGQNPDRTGFLVSAIQQLENYIKNSTQKDEISTVRGLISLLSQLVNKDQQSMAAEL